jgi:hypothetical protein
MKNENELHIALELTVREPVDDLGAAAYLLMMGWKVIGKKDKSFVFEIEQSSKKEFADCHLEYLNSDFHRFDSCLMSLKKMHQQVS